SGRDASTPRISAPSAAESGWTSIHPMVAKKARRTLGRASARLLLRDTGGEPVAATADDQQHRPIAGLGRHGGELAVDAEIAIRLERHEPGIERRTGTRPAEKPRPHALARVRANRVAARDQEAAALDRNAPLGSYVGAQARDNPRLAAGVDAAYDVRDAADSRRHDAYSTIEPHKPVVRARLKRQCERRCQHSSRYCFIPHSTLPNLVVLRLKSSATRVDLRRREHANSPTHSRAQRNGAMEYASVRRRCVAVPTTARSRRRLPRRRPASPPARRPDRRRNRPAAGRAARCRAC